MADKATTTTYDPLEGVTAKTTKDELMERLRKAAAAMRSTDRKRAATLEEIEQRLVAKGQNREPLMQVIFSGTEAEWDETLAFLEEFEVKDLLPPALQRLAIGGRVLLGRHEDGDDNGDGATS